MDLLDLREPVSALTHGAWMLLAPLATVWLWRQARGDRAKRLSLLVFGMSLLFCYSASMLYHGLTLPEDRLAIFERLDHVGIMVLIAGSYTPLAWNILKGRWRWGLLGLVWTATAATAVRLMVWGLLSRMASTTIYLGMGWLVLVCLAEITRHLPRLALRPLVAGGISYSVGAVLNLIDWPILWPGVFQAHELFHLFVMAGSLAHFWFMLRVVAPHEGHGLSPTSPPPAQPPVSVGLGH